MAKAELGKKRVCLSCNMRFYDFDRNPIICPGCGAEFDPQRHTKSVKSPRILQVETKVNASIDEVEKVTEVVASDDMDFDEDELAQEVNEIEEQEKQGLLMAQAPNLPKLQAGLLKPQNSDEELAALMNEDKAKIEEKDKLLAELMA